MNNQLNLLNLRTIPRGTDPTVAAMPPMLSTFAAGDVPRGSDSTQNSRTCLSKKVLGAKERPMRLKSPLSVLAWGVSAISGISAGLHWALRTLDKPFGFFVLKPAGGRCTYGRIGPA